MATSNFLESQLLNLVLRNEATDSPPNPSEYPCVALFTSSVGLEEGLFDNEVYSFVDNIVTNPSTGYQRQGVGFVIEYDNNNSPYAKLVDPGFGTPLENGRIFPDATASWGTVTHMAVVDRLQNNHGKILFWGEVAMPKTIGVDDTFLIPSDSWKITIK